MKTSCYSARGKGRTKNHGFRSTGGSKSSGIKSVPRQTRKRKILATQVITPNVSEGALPQTTFARAEKIPK
jgi:hypothetical protein